MADLRDVTVTFANHQMFGDENLEIWMEIVPAAWALHDTVAVELDGGGAVVAEQSYVFEDVEEGVTHNVQIRATRGGAYRSLYLPADPDEWPEASRLTFIPGGAEIAAPSIVSTAWERTAADSERIGVTITPLYTDRDLELLRDGTVVGTAAAPHVGDVTIYDVDMPGETTHTYTARHAISSLKGDESTEASQYAGPPMPTGVTTSGVVACSYTAEWTVAQAGAATEVYDDYLAANSFGLRELTDADAVDATIAHGSGGITCDGTLIPVQVRLRHRWTQFGTSDYSQYTANSDIELCDTCS